MSSLSGLPVNDASAIEDGSHASGLCASLTVSPHLWAQDVGYLKITFSFNVPTLSPQTVTLSTSDYSVPRAAAAQCSSKGGANSAPNTTPPQQRSFWEVIWEQISPQLPQIGAVYESPRDSSMSGELRRVLKALEGLIVAFVDGAPGVDPGGRRADDHHHRGGGEHHD
jgi:hypothetical protein